MKQTTESVSEFREYSVCQKCNWNHMPPSPPTTKYEKKLKLLVRTCLNCGYSWHEKPADEVPPPDPAAPPAEPSSMWKKIETKK
jgi:hypothetical protein